MGEQAVGGADAPLVRAFAVVRELLDRPSYALSGVEVVEVVRQAQALIAAVHAVKLTYLQELDVRPELVAGAPAGKAAFTFLTEALHESRAQANRDVAARALMSGDAELPRMAEA